MIDKVMFRVCLVDFKDPNHSPVYQSILQLHGPKVANRLTKMIVVNMKGEDHAQMAARSAPFGIGADP